jgi:hypothetical protein
MSAIWWMGCWHGKEIPFRKNDFCEDTEKAFGYLTGNSQTLFSLIICMKNNNIAKLNAAGERLFLSAGVALSLIFYF